MSDERLVQQLLAQYVLAVDRRDGDAVFALFSDEARVDIAYNRSGAEEPIATLSGAAAIGEAVTGLMAPHPLRGWSHHITSDHIILVEGDAASLDAQFMVYNVVGAEQPEDGWAPSALGMQGSVVAAESGYYRSELTRRAGAWKFTSHKIIQDLPFAMPARG